MCGLEKICDSRRIGNDFRHTPVPLRLVEQIGFLQVGALQFDIGLPRQAGETDIGLRRLCDRRHAVDLRVGDRGFRILNVDEDTPHVADLDTVEKDRAATPEARRRAWNADTQHRRFAPVANRGGPVDESEGRKDRKDREYPNDYVVGSGFHRFIYFYALAPRSSCRARFPRK